MKKSIFIIIFSALLFACSKENELPSGLRAGGFKLADNAKQSSVITELKKEGITFIIDNNGAIQYMQKDLAKVRSIKRRIQDGPELKHTTWETEIAFNEDQLGVWKRHFEKHNIPFQVQNNDGFISIQWSQIYAEKVDMIAQEVGFELFEKATN